MSDRDLILDFLRKAEKRTRSNKRFNEIAATLAVALLVPVAFKVLDFYFLFRARTVTTFMALWLAATIAWIVFRARGRSSLSQIAGSIDHTAGLKDQLKTAYWFIENPRDSEWVHVQIQRTARDTGRLRLNAILPRRLPRASLLVAALLFLLVALNFIPLSLNHNWVLLQAAPPFQLTAVERASLENALKLLDRAKAAENSQVAQKIEDLIEQLEQGDISVDDAVKELGELQAQLESGELDAANTSNGLAQMAAILRQARALQAAAQPMAAGDLDGAATQIHDLDERLDTVSNADLRDMSEKLQEAAEKPRSGLENLAQAFDNTAGALQRGDRAATHSGLDRISKELQSLAQQLQDQQLRSEAGDEIGDLIDALEENQQQGQATAQSGKPRSGQNKPGEKSAGKGERGDPSDAQEQNSSSPEDSAQAGQPGGAGDPSEKQAEGGESGGGTTDEAPNGKGGNSFGGSTKSAPLEGEATSLEVQLQKEALKIEPSEGNSPDKDTEAASERERSKLDYRNAPSNLTPAQKDLLSQDRIPWERRQLIKNYFEAVKPKQTQ